MIAALYRYKVNDSVGPSLETTDLLRVLLDFLEENYPLPFNSEVGILYDYGVYNYEQNGELVTGTISVTGRKAVINVAAKDRLLRAIALTTAHEYMHCIQFIERDMYMSKKNKEEMENEAITFAEDVLKRLWNEQKIYFPSTI